MNREGHVPDDPSIFQYSPASDVIGCNRVRCTSCLAFVRQRAGIKIKGGGDPDPEELYELADWSTSSDLTPSPHFARLYVCRCETWVEMATTSLDQDDPVHPTPPWACGGHPRVTLPRELDGIGLDSTTDVARLVKDVLAKRLVPPGAFPGEKIMTRSWILKLYELLLASTNGKELAARIPPAVASFFEGPASAEPAVRAEAIGFFQAHPEATGWEKPLERFLAAPGEFVGVVVPTMEPPTLEDVLVWFAGQRAGLRAKQGESLEALVLEVLVKGLVAAHARAGKLGDKATKETAERWLRFLGKATACDDRSIAARAEEIVRGAPAAALPLLEALHAAKSARLLEVATKLAALPGVDRAALEAFGEKAGGQVKAALRRPR